MEHRDLLAMAEIAGCTLDMDQAAALLAYARMIESTNEQFNLTGHGNLHEIVENLILGSIRSIEGLSVPRGTRFVDIGTGAGIPGIPLGIYQGTWRGVLVDSNAKKISFVKKVIRDCCIENLNALHCRAEDLARGRERETFDLALSRAAGNPLVVVEIGAPLIKIGGYLYIYAHDLSDILHDRIRKHGADLGLSLIPRSRYREYGLKEGGILFLKNEITPSTFPRRMAVMKRMARKSGVG